MKSHITVILKNTSTNILSDLKSSLELHRLDENSLKYLKSHHWDYWFLPQESEFNDVEIEKKFTELDKEILSNTSYIKNLPKDYTTSGIIDLEENWIDLQDFGWKMIHEPSDENRNSLKKWSLKCKEILKRNRNHICVQVILHN
ncbi:hypothetical protein FBALC1_05353 [Flavobacteriales bacterium ALC-1]|nr:hypothetical protein FBALC1_05353 [Flavobacteriales bacterium ALC-1]